MCCWVGGEGRMGLEGTAFGLGNSRLAKLLPKFLWKVAFAALHCFAGFQQFRRGGEEVGIRLGGFFGVVFVIQCIYRFHDRLPVASYNEITIRTI